MADETKEQTDSTHEPQAGQAPAAEPQNTDTSTPGPVPYERFKEVTAELKKLKEWRTQQETAETERQKEAEKAKQKSLKEQEKWQELAQAHETKVAELEPQVTALQAERDQAYEVLAAHAEAMLESVPALFRPLVESLPVLQRMAWLNENRDKLTAGRPAGTPVTPNGRGRGDLTDEERRQKSRSIQF